MLIIEIVPEIAFDGYVTGRNLNLLGNVQQYSDAESDKYVKVMQKPVPK